MRYRTVPLVLPIILLSVPLSGFAGAPIPNVIQNCITYEKNSIKTLDAMCKVLKCTGKSVHPSDADLERGCTCEDGTLRSRLSRNDYNLYLKFMTPHTVFSDKEDVRWTKYVWPVVDEVNKACNLP